MEMSREGMDQIVERITSLFSQSNEVNQFSEDPDGWVEENLPEGTEPADVASCMPQVASRLGGVHQSNLANYTSHGAPVTPTPAAEVAYTYNTVYQQNAFVLAGEGSNVNVINGDGNQVNQAQIDLDFGVEPAPEPEPLPDEPIILKEEYPEDEATDTEYPEDTDVEQDHDAEYPEEADVEPKALVDDAPEGYDDGYEDPTATDPGWEPEGTGADAYEAPEAPVTEAPAAEATDGIEELAG